MKLSLNTKSITDEMLALSALRSVTAAEPGAAPLLTRDSLPGLRVIMRMVFAEIMLDLAACLESCSIDEENPEPDEPYSDETPLRLEATFSLPATLPAGMELTIKRQLEHLVAAGTMGWIASGSERGDTAFAATMQAQREGALAALRERLSGTAEPFTRVSWP